MFNTTPQCKTYIHPISTAGAGFYRSKSPPELVRNRIKVLYIQDPYDYFHLTLRPSFISCSEAQTQFHFHLSPNLTKTLKFYIYTYIHLDNSITGKCSENQEILLGSPNHSVASLNSQMAAAVKTFRNKIVYSFWQVIKTR